jgi:hypothetical protein
MVALADQLVEFLDRHPVFPKIAQVQFHIPFIQKCLRFATRRASRLLQKLDF